MQQQENKDKERIDIEALANTEEKRAEEHKNLHHGSRATLWVLVIVAVVIGGGILCIAPYMMTGADEDVTIRIPRNATIENVSDTLDKYYPEDYARKVKTLLTVAGFKPEERYGLYVIPKGATPFATMRKIARGGQTPVKLTITGFRSLDYIADRMSRKVDFTPEQFLKAATDPKVLAQYGLDPEHALSLFMEDTYEVYWTSTPEEVVKKIGDAYQNYWNEGRKRTAADLGLTPAEIMVIASIVDDETNQELEKGRIGRLYINRLDKGMKLQADPTVKFALNDLTIRRVTNEHLKVDNPYNTYMYPGVPPGPIRTSSRKTVSSILNSEPSNDIYMCAREDFSGFHNFSATYEEHLDNAHRYQQELDARNIK